MERLEALGGKLIIATKRGASVCEGTRQKLSAVALNVDQVLCKAVGVSDQNPQFSAVQGALPKPDVPPTSSCAARAETEFASFAPSMPNTGTDSNGACACTGPFSDYQPNTVEYRWRSNLGLDCW